MIARLLCLAVLCASPSLVWAQYQPSGTQPRTNRQSQVVPVPGRTEAVGPKEFRFSEEERPREPVYRGGPVTEPALRGVGRDEEPHPLQRASQGANANPNARQIACPWEPLTAREQQQLDNLMALWEQHSSQIERYRCNFERWEYDPVFGPKDPKTAKTYGQGRLLYASPDKGLFHVQQLSVYVPAAKPGEKEQWLKRPAEEIGEHWVCDGKSVYEFDARQKKLIQRELPPEMQGKAIVDGPLPFLFGAKADKIKARYWLRLITPADVKGEQWIEASPKFAGDAKNFKMVHVIIDEKDFLPKAIQVFDPNFDPEKRPIRSVYTFNDRQFNWNTTLEKINLFHREFYEPATPLGWTKVPEPFFPEPGQSTQPKTPPTAGKPNPLKLPFRFR